ncbi:MAG: glycerol-3-phosphate 1-O-acyltransferase PlsY [Acidobacteria bacterium]|nr:glycerol-3-phosphate 1-O-acyltransferase PlsY [Acidobacteriota bacterium]
MEELFAVTLGYLVGSVPCAFLLARRRGIDLRRVGSGNIGAANVLRTSGVAQALGAVSLDAAKGALAVLVAGRLTEGPATPVAAGLTSVIGHIYPVWLRFRGGKGVATAAGAFAVLAPIAAALAASVFVVAIWVTRYISVGSMTAAVTLAVATMASEGLTPVSVGALVAALIIIERHRANLGRLAAGTERRIGQRI